VSLPLQSAVKQALGDTLKSLGAFAFLASLASAGPVAAIPGASLAPTALGTTPGASARTTIAVPSKGPAVAGGAIPTNPALWGKPAVTKGVSHPLPGVMTSGAKPAMAEVTALVMAGGEQRGSAVILRRASGGTWLVTNRHVVDGESNVCVRTADGRLWPGLTVIPSKQESLDVAFLWLPQSDSPRMSVAALVASKPQAKAGQWDFPIVLSSGYPVREEKQAAPPAYRELSGLLLPLLARPLEGGMQLATTAAVRKGMSGGGLFDNQGQLIGINTTHADPLWSTPLREESGKNVPTGINRKLELVALAIPIARILPLLQQLEPPATQSQGRNETGAMSGSPRTGTPGQASGTMGAMPSVCSGALW
jgi:S1-C subfamily serine protease